MAAGGGGGEEGAICAGGVVARVSVQRRKPPPPGRPVLRAGSRQAGWQNPSRRRRHQTPRGATRGRGGSRGRRPHPAAHGRGARGHRASLTHDPGRAGPPLRRTARRPRGRRAPAPHRAHLESGTTERPPAITCRRPLDSAPGPRVSPGARPSAAGQSRTTLAPAAACRTHNPELRARPDSPRGRPRSPRTTT